MTELEKYRKEIERIDKDLAKLINERMNISLKIGEFKKTNGISVFDPKREEELKNINVAKVEKRFQKAYSEIFDVILKVSKDAQL